MVVSIASDSEFKQTIGKPSLTVVDWYADWYVLLTCPNIIQHVFNVQMGLGQVWTV
jgi:hypothetical protein